MMLKDRIIEKVLNDISLDSRIEDGIFDIKKNEHVGYLCEYLISKGIERDVVYEFTDMLLEKGKFPERQAYNRNGILVTFPTPEYKKDAIKAGTHFEQDPTKGRPNIFQNKPAPTTEPPKSGADTPTKTSLPVSTSTATPPPAEKSGEEPSVEPAQKMPNAFTTAAPQQAPADEEPKEPTELPPPKVKSPKEREADKDIIKKMLKGDDYMLDESFLKKTSDVLNRKSPDEYKSIADEWVSKLNPFIFNSAIKKYPDSISDALIEVLKLSNFRDFYNQFFGIAATFIYYYVTKKIQDELLSWTGTHKFKV